jgi:hypothetical protein
VGPPLDLVDLVKMNVDFFARRGRGCLEGPGRFVDEDRVGEVALLWYSVSIELALLLGSSAGVTAGITRRVPQ